jgi:GDP-4-dehydro-6-deoxy-D-mannose reductase
MLRVLITGADGFVGRHLAHYLAQEEGAEVLGLGLHPSMGDGPWDGCKYQVCDIMDAASLRRIVLDFRPDYIFHLAAQSSVRQSWEQWERTYDVALKGQCFLMEAVRDLGEQVRVHVACSAEEYGKVREEDLPLKEDQPLRPASPYAMSKVIQDYLAIFYHQAHGLKTVRTRAFNQTGPGQSPRFVVSDFARQIALIETGQRPPVLEVGNLEAKRDFSDVRDLVRAYWALLREGQPGEVYNVCSGRAYSIREILGMLLEMSRAKIEVRVEPTKVRPLDIPVLVGDCSRLRMLTGWEPRIPLDQTLRDVLEWWRERLLRTGGKVED